MGVVQPDFLTSELHLTQNTGILLCPSSPNFGELVFCLKCLVNGTPGSNSCLMSKVTNSQKQAALKFCYCRKKTDEQSVLCCNPKCPIVSFHWSCLKIESIPKTWYCPHCRNLTEFKKSRKAKSEEPKKKKGPSAPNPAMSFDFICMCKSKPNESEKLLKCHSESCENGRFFPLKCLNYKRMPNNSQTTWTCPSCRKKGKVTCPQKGDVDNDDVTFIKTLHTRTEKYLWWALERMSSA